MNAITGDLLIHFVWPTPCLTLETAMEWSRSRSGNWSLRGAATVALMEIRNEPPDPMIAKLADMSDWGSWHDNAMMVGQFGARA